MIEYIRKRPMLCCSVFAVILCVTNYYWEWAPWVGLTLIAVFFLIFPLFRARPSSFFALALLIPLCFSLWMTNRKIQSLSRFDKTKVSGTFIVTEAPVDHGIFASVIVEAKEALPLAKGVRLLLRGQLSRYEMGNIIHADALLGQIEPDKFGRGWYSESVFLDGDVWKSDLVEGDGDPVLSAVRDLRAAIETRLFASMEAQEAATLSAVLLGDKTHLDGKMENLVRRAGVSHIMVVSGLHLAIIIGLILRLTRLLTNAPLARFFVIFITAVFLTVLCGFTKSILRASLCLVIYAVSLLIGREHTPDNTLGGAVTLLLIFSPFIVFSISFQLSVLSTLGILVCALPLIGISEKRPLFRNRFCKEVFAGILIAFCATCFALPVTLYTFGGVSTVGILSNLLLLPVMTPMLMLTAVCLPVSFLAPIVLRVPGMMASYVNGVIRLLGGLSFSYLYTNSFEAALSVLLPVLLFFVSVTLQRKEKRSRKKQTAKKKAETGQIL